VAIQENGRTLLIDAATELRLQALRAGLHRVDAALFTHAHADHVGGLDDLRSFNIAQGTVIPCYGDQDTIYQIQTRFPYIFDSFMYFGARPELSVHVVDGAFSLFGLEVTPVPVFHGWLPILGYRIGKLAYVTDCNAIPPSSLELLRGLDLLVLDALRDRPHPSHFTVREALAVIEELAPRRTFLTHISHELDHEDTSRYLPAGVALAYDGLVVEVEG
jgi:phosphoribosyl 1,2-cyclic phosphate phosphodiesterase